MTASEHPNDVELELARTGEADAAISSHVQACPECQERSGLFVRLAEELGPEVVRVPPELDAAILAVATERAQLRPPVELRPQRRRWLWAVPAVAAAALVLVLWQVGIERGPVTPTTLAAAPDVNADGTVDIVDAMLLARALEREARADWDMNGDARVDDGDVQLIAMAAVSLDRRGP